MSHMVSIAIEIKDLEALKSACIELGAQWMQGQKTHKWYGQSLGDFPLPKGITVDMLGKCDHAIKLPGVNYEIGVVKMPNGSYTLLYDFFGSGDYNGAHDGGKLRAHFGEGLKKLVQMYGVHVATAAAKRRGLMVGRSIQKGGVIRLQITGRSL